MRKRLLRSRSGFEKPESREEAIMQNILGASNVLEPSESNIEEILKSILYNIPYTQEAEFEIEKILLAIKNNGTYDGECGSRDLKILFAILNDLDYTEEAESRIEELFIEWLHQRSKVKVLEGIPPLTFVAKGEPLINYEISGNTVQSGTPTPDSPVMPEGTGERTGNLFDENYESISSPLTYTPIYLGDGQFTLSSNIPFTGGTANIFFLAGNVSSGASTVTNGVYDGQSRTVSSVEGYVTIAYCNQTADPRLYKTMLNTGSTALPYEPFGVKIPISSANTTTPVYLGEVETTRKVKKLVLTGSETWYAYSAGNVHQFYTQNMVIGGVVSSSAYSTIAPYGMTVDSRIGDYGCYLVSSGNEIAFQMYGSKADFPTQTEWKAYLAQQYANGTPVTIWYVLATPSTGIVNEPIRKIGDYADTLSMEQAGVQIPTNNGSNTLDVETTVKPSNIYIEYK